VRSGAGNERGAEACRGERAAINVRTCIVCRADRPQEQFIRLTVDFSSNEVRLNEQNDQTGKPHIHGRSAYFCRSSSCAQAALKNTRLKLALEGRKKKGTPPKRSISWPLEPQLIKLISAECTEP